MIFYLETRVLREEETEGGEEGGGGEGGKFVREEGIKENNGVCKENIYESYFRNVAGL